MQLKYILDICDSPDTRTFEQRLINFAHTLDFGLASAALVIENPTKPAEVIAIGNTPAGFVDASTDPADIKRDPVIQRLKKLRVPFTYDQGLYVNSGTFDLWEKQAPFGYQTGIAVAVDLPHGKHLLLGIDRDKKLPANETRLTHMLGLVQLLATYTKKTAERLLAPVTEVDSCPHLTSREIDVLRITAEGKSAWVTGQILSISEFTVNYHMRNIHRKLRTSSKPQAVHKASTLGLL